MACHELLRPPRLLQCHLDLYTSMWSSLHPSYICQVSSKCVNGFWNHKWSEFGVNITGYWLLLLQEYIASKQLSTPTLKKLMMLANTTTQFVWKSLNFHKLYTLPVGAILKFVHYFIIFTCNVAAAAWIKLM